MNVMVRGSQFDLIFFYIYKTRNKVGRMHALMRIHVRGDEINSKSQRLSA